VARDRVRRPRSSYKGATAEWRDPYPSIMGSKPEKMVLALMVQRRIPFIFQALVRDIVPGTTESYRLDFYIPSTRMVVEVFGDYWHTLGSQPFADAKRAAYLESQGVREVVWWESDILSRLTALFDAVPELRNPPVTGPPISVENKYDDLRAVRTANARRAGKTALTYRRTTRVRKQARRV
jgi:hypothetical protein